MALANIIDNLATALAGINGSAPYSTTVARVNERLVNNHHISGSNLPALGVMVESVEHADSVDIGQALPKATIRIEGWVELPADSEGNPTPPHDVLLPLWEDVKTALRVDNTRGGLVADSRFTLSTFQYGETEAMFAIQFVCEYAEAI